MNFIFRLHLLLTFIGINFVDCSFNHRQLSFNNEVFCGFSATVSFLIGFLLPCGFVAFIRYVVPVFTSYFSEYIFVDTVGEAFQSIDKAGGRNIYYCHRNCNCFVFIFCLLIPSFICALASGYGAWYLCGYVVTRK